MGERIGPVRHRANERPVRLGRGTGHLAAELLQELGAALVPGEARAGVQGGVEGEGREALEKGGPLVAHATAELPAIWMKVYPSGLWPGEAVDPALGRRSSTGGRPTMGGKSQQNST